MCGWSLDDFVCQSTESYKNRFKRNPMKGRSAYRQRSGADKKGDPGVAFS